MNSSSAPTPSVLALINEEYAVYCNGLIITDIPQDQLDFYVNELQAGRRNVQAPPEGKSFLMHSVTEIEADGDFLAFKVGKNWVHLIVEDRADRDEFLEAINSQYANAFERTIKQRPMVISAFLPSIAIVLSLILGGRLIWFADIAQEPITRTKMVKTSTLILYSAARLIGPWGAMAITAIVFALLCTWFFKSINKPNASVILRRHGAKDRLQAAASH